MDRRIESKVVDTAGAISNTIINKDLSMVHWLTISIEAQGAPALIQIYDGFDVEGVLKWQLEPSYAHQCLFIPPIFCNEGIFVYTDDGIACYTIGYHPGKCGG